MKRFLRIVPVVAAAPLLWIACGSKDGDSGSHVNGDGAGGTSTGTGGIILGIGGTPLPGQGGQGGGQAVQIVTSLPTGFTAAETAANPGPDDQPPKGGYHLVGPLKDAAAPSSEACANILRVVVRDFVTYGHPDFGGSKDPSDAK